MKTQASKTNTQEDSKVDNENLNRNHNTHKTASWGSSFALYLQGHGFWSLCYLVVTKWEMPWQWNRNCKTVKRTKHLKAWQEDWKKKQCQGNGCGSIGIAVASDTRGLRFESSHRQNLYWTFFYRQLYWTDENKEKEAGNDPVFKKLCLSEEERKNK